MDIRDYIGSYTNYPVLFIGTGMSLRYLKESYSWDSLLKTIVQVYDSEEHYLDISGASNFDYPSIGSVIEAEFNDYCSAHRTGLLEDINNQYYELLKARKNVSRLKLYIASLLKGKIELKPEKESEINALKAAMENVSSVITTNYDSFIEDVLGFQPIIANDILFSNPYGSVYKIHGSVSDPGSIVLTSEDYKEFETNAELIKSQLISLFVHNPVIFLGYGINDTNILSLLRTIFKYVPYNTDAAKKISSNFLIIEYQPDSENTEVTDYDIKLEEIGDIRIKKLATDDYTGLFEEISDLELPVPAKDVKKVIKIMKTIVEGGEIKVRIADGIEELEDTDKVLAIGKTDSKLFAVPYSSSSDIINDYFTFMDGEGDTSLLESINSFTNLYSIYFPIIGLSTQYPDINDLEGKKNYEREATKQFIKKQCLKYTSSHTSINDIMADTTIATTYKYKAIICAYYKDQITSEDVSEFLKDSLLEDKRDPDMRKLLCLYDIKNYDK